ncbi:MAG TPA: acyl-CoA reductase [Longimicrobiales bacterium]|nr:acyl-CoA reductase [Longimicrobiales bacterium]
MTGPNPADLASTARRLREARTDLLARTALELAEVVGAVGERFLAAGDPLRDEALALIPGEAGLSPAMARRVLDGMALDWTRPRLELLLRSEFTDPAVLDGFVAIPPTPVEAGAPGHFRLVRALGDGLALHVGAGSVPGVCATSLARSLLVKTPVLVKPGAGDRALTELFLRGLREADPAVAGAAAVEYWPGGDAGLEKAAVALADRLVVYGSDGACRSIRDRVPVHVPVVLYHHRNSVAVVGPDATRDPALPDTAAALAFAASTFDQRGCVSPHRVWVLGSRQDAERLAEATAGAMAREAAQAPPGPRSEAEAARLQQLRGSAEIRQAAGGGVRLWSDAGTAWTVILEEGGGVETAGTPRTLVVTWVPAVEELASALAGEGLHLQSVGLAELGSAEGEVVETLARMGATRLAPLADIPFPPAWWLHDGQGPLRALVRWAEWTR